MIVLVKTRNSSDDFDSNLSLTNWPIKELHNYFAHVIVVYRNILEMFISKLDNSMTILKELYLLNKCLCSELFIEIRVLCCGDFDMSVEHPGIFLKHNKRLFFIKNQSFKIKTKYYLKKYVNSLQIL